ncbi:MAG TPA: diaminopimelate decarboxylase, partial [Sphaerochaeta sp.]|nr:diaminopimelate decarboxylase [Sphaerochaeta sp.]
MNEKNLPLTSEQLQVLSEKIPTPFYLYDEKAIVENARKFISLFSWAPGFRNYYAVKACPNPSILSILKKEGFGSDCSSLPEILLSEASGITGENIMFTSNNTPPEEFVAAYKAGAIINL